ncbi:MAG: hypothetical protein ACREBE_26540, partial [bacterium]
EVMKWPDISIRQLLDKQPTYTDLQAGYHTKVALQLDLPWPKATQPALHEAYGNTVALSELQPGTQVQFYCGKPTNVDPGRFWWAIPSVWSDPAYPYRTMFAN